MAYPATQAGRRSRAKPSSVTKAPQADTPCHTRSRRVQPRDPPRAPACLQTAPAAVIAAGPGPGRGPPTGILLTGYGLPMDIRPVFWPALARANSPPPTTSTGPRVRPAAALVRAPPVRTRCSPRGAPPRRRRPLPPRTVSGRRDACAPSAQRGTWLGRGVKGVQGQPAPVHLNEVGGRQRRGRGEERIEPGQLEDMEQALVAFVMLPPGLPHGCAAADGHGSVHGPEHPVPDGCDSLVRACTGVGDARSITGIEKPSGDG